MNRRRTPRPLRLPGMRWASALTIALPWLSLAMLLPGTAQGRRADNGPPPGSLYLELTEGALAAELQAADEAARRGELEPYDRLLERSLDAHSDRLVPIFENESAAFAPARAKPHVRYESLSRALRRRLRAQLAKDPRAWSAMHAARARARYERFAREGDIGALIGCARRYPFTEAGSRSALLAGDLLLEQGRLTLARAAYRLATEVAPPEHPLDLSARVERTHAVAPKPVSLPAHPLVLSLEPQTGEGKSALAPSTVVRPCALPGAIALARPNELVWLKMDANGALLATRRLPPGAIRRVGLEGLDMRLGAVSRGMLLAAPLAHLPLLDRAPGEPAPENPLRADFDLFVFDLAREGALLATSAETKPLHAPSTASPERPLELEYAGVPVLVEGALAATAASRGSEPELFVAAFDTSTLSPLWRTFVCAPRLRRPHTGPGPALRGALTVADTVLLVESGVGVRAALDVLTGEIRWLVWVPISGDEGALNGPLDRRRLFNPRPVAAPLFLPQDPEHSSDALAVFLSAGDGLLRARRVTDGRIAWRVIAEKVTRALAATDRFLVALEGERLLLIDRVSGKRLDDGVALPSGVAVAGLGAASARGQVLIPLISRRPLTAPPTLWKERDPIGGFCLRLTVVETENGAKRLVADGALPLSVSSRFDVVTLGTDAAGCFTNERLHLWPRFGQDWGERALNGLALLYGIEREGSGLDPLGALGALKRLKRPSPPKRVCGYRLESTIEPAGGFRARARPLSPPLDRPWIEWLREADGSIRALVRSPEPSLTQTR